MTNLNVTKYPGNRRYYSPTLKRYTCLTEIGDYWDQGVKVTISRSTDGADMTAASLLRLLAQRVESGVLEVSEARLREIGRSV
jgi:polyhydroxyalkanoate synthesis regulator protein